MFEVDCEKCLEMRLGHLGRPEVGRDTGMMQGFALRVSHSKVCILSAVHLLGLIPGQLVLVSEGVYVGEWNGNLTRNCVEHSELLLTIIFVGI